MKRNSILLGLLLICMAATAQTTQQADSLHQRGRELLNEGKIAEGRECTRQAMEMRKALLGEVSEDYSTTASVVPLIFGLLLYLLMVWTNTKSVWRNIRWISEKSQISQVCESQVCEIRNNLLSLHSNISSYEKEFCLRSSGY